MSQRRKQLGITAERLAGILGVDRKSLSSWESSDASTMPRNIYVLDAWCEQLGLSMGQALDNNASVIEADFITDPRHMRAVRLWYGRYLNDKSFSQTIHKITPLCSETLDLLNQLIEKIAKTTLEDGDWISRQDLTWDKTVAVARDRGTLKDMQYIWK
jgi:transcriptional regulator with XRE-family HTH domain